MIFWGCCVGKVIKFKKPEKDKPQAMLVSGSSCFIFADVIADQINESINKVFEDAYKKSQDKTK